MKRIMSQRFLFCCALIAALSVPALAAETSDLWGEHGEKWTPQSRLPDFSYAGYHCGEQPLPTLPPGVSVKDFGAKGDGVTDDTDAFLKALAEAPAGAIEIPAGRYKITKILEITRPGIVLRGEGPDKTILCFPTQLNDIRPDWGATTSGQRTSNYSWAGGFVWFKGNRYGRTVTTITAPAKRGDTTLRVVSTAALKAGERIQLVQHDPPDKSLSVHLYSGDPGNIAKLRNTEATLVCRIKAFRGNAIDIDRPLRCDVELRWTPQIRRFEPSVTESGIEHLTFEFPNTPYRGHFTELGYNAIAMSAVADCWARDIRIVNPDSGIFPGCNFCTFQGVVFESSRQPDKALKATGHHGIYMSGDDNLFTDFQFKTRFVHDITVAHHGTGNVCSHGAGEDLCFDHHKYAPYENLFSDIDAGAGTRLWRCGGGDALGKNCGARGTFWNIRAKKPLGYPPASFGPPSMNLVALFTEQPSIKEPDGKWFEAIKPEALTPRDLYQAQLARRLQWKR